MKLLWGLLMATLPSPTNARFLSAEKVLQRDEPDPNDDPLGPGPALGEDPVDLLCTVGTRDPPQWCRDWVGCIETGAAPGNSAESVKTAWGPAQCEEYCGVTHGIIRTHGMRQGII